MSNTTPAIYHNGHFYGNEVGNTILMDNKLNKLSDNIAPKQDTDTASKLIDVGEYFINKDGYLCQCDIQIANQGTITVGTNCHLIPNGLANELSGKIVDNYFIYGMQMNSGILSTINNRAYIALTNWGTGNDNALRIRLHQKESLDYFIIKIYAPRTNTVNGNDYTICTMQVSPAYFQDYQWYGKKSLCTGTNSKIVLACNYTGVNTSTDYIDILLINSIMAEVEVSAYTYMEVRDPIKTGRIIPSECCCLPSIPSSSSYTRWVETGEH